MNIIRKAKNTKNSVCKIVWFTAPNKIYLGMPKTENIQKKWCIAIKQDEKLYTLFYGTPK